MRVLIFGACVIGSIYALWLSQSGCGVTVLARGRRLEELRKHGLLYRDGIRVQKADVKILHRVFCGYMEGREDR